MKKKILSFALVIIMVLSLTSISSLAANSYADIKSHWAQSAIEKWSDFGIVQGSNGQFRPDDPMTRGELAVVIDRIMKYQKEATNSFTDLGQAFYTDAVLKANAAGVILGDGASIRPTDNMTKEEAAVILARALGVSVNTEAAVSFSDNASISSWAVGFVNAMAAKGFIHGYNNAFNPKATITRAEIVTILNNAVSTICTDSKEYTGTVSGTVIVNTPGVSLTNMKINGDLIISEGTGNGDVTLNNVTVTGNTIIRGGGVNSIHINGNSHITNIIIQKTDDGSIRVVTADGTVVDAVFVDDGKDDVVLTGSFTSITVASDVNVNLTGATIQTLNVAAAKASISIDAKSTVKTLAFSDTAGGSKIQNKGTVTTANVNANGVIIDGNKPGKLNVGSNVTQGPTDSSGKPVTEDSAGAPSGGGGGPTLVDAVAPVITYDLKDVTTSVDAPITLDATATVSDDGALSYAWYSTSSPTAEGTAIDGETNAAFKPDVSTAGTYYYYCIVTNTNTKATGNTKATTKSTVAKITVVIDNAPPTFVDPYPQSANIGSNSFDVLVKANEAVTYYYVTYPSDGGHPDPDADQVCAGKDGANNITLAMRSGKLGPVDVGDDPSTLSVTHVYGNRTYTVFIVAVDQSGNKTEVSIDVTTLDDTTPPVFKTGYPKETLVGSNSADFLAQCDEASNIVQYHWIAYVSDTNRSNPDAEQVIAGTDGNGSSAGVSKYTFTGWENANTDTPLYIENLSASTTYDVFIIAIDSVGNKSDVAKRTITTRTNGDSSGHLFFISRGQSDNQVWDDATQTYQCGGYLDGVSTTLTIPLVLDSTITSDECGIYNVTLDSTGKIVTGICVPASECSGTGYTADSGSIIADTAGTASTFSYAAGCLVYYVDNDTFTVTVLPVSGIQSIDTNDLISVWSSGSSPTDATVIVITKIP